MTQENQNPNSEQENSTPDAAEAAPEAAAPLTPEQEIAELNQKLTDMQDNFLRAKAEGENIRRRAVEDVAKAHKFAIENFAEHLVPVTDSLYAALSTDAGDAKAFKEGLEITLKQLLSAFEKGRMTKLILRWGINLIPTIIRPLPRCLLSKIPIPWFQCFSGDIQ